MKTKIKRKKGYLHQVKGKVKKAMVRMAFKLKQANREVFPHVKDR